MLLMLQVLNGRAKQLPALGAQHVNDSRRSPYGVHEVNRPTLSWIDIVVRDLAGGTLHRANTVSAAMRKKFSHTSDLASVAAYLQTYSRCTLLLGLVHKSKVQMSGIKQNQKWS